MSIARRAAALLVLSALPGAAMGQAAPPPRSAPRAPAPLPPVDPARLAAARVLVDVIDPPALRSEAFSGAARQAYARFQVTPHLPAGIEDAGLLKLLTDFNTALSRAFGATRERHVPALVDAIAQAYAREYSLDELRAILAFVATPAGRHFAQGYNKVLGMGPVASADMAYQAELNQQGADATRRLDADIASYMAAHPQLAASIRAAQPQTGAPRPR